MNRFRRGRLTRFTQITNEAIDLFDDVLTVGLHAILLRLPDDCPMTMDELARRRKQTSRRALYRSMRDLVDKGYVVKVKHQDRKGHWSTDTYSFDTPAELQEIEELLLQYGRMKVMVEPCWLDPTYLAEQADQAEQPEPPPAPQRGESTPTDRAKSHVGPTSENVEDPQAEPTFTDRQVGNRQVGNRQAQNPQALKKTGGNTRDKKKPPSSPPATSTPHTDDHPTPEEEAARSAEEKKTPAGRILRHVESGEPAHRRTHGEQRATLLVRLGTALDAGWNEDDLAEKVGGSLLTASNVYACIKTRLDNLGAPPRRTLPRQATAPDVPPVPCAIDGCRHGLITVYGSGSSPDRVAQCPTCRPHQHELQMGDAQRRGLDVTTFAELLQHLHQAANPAPASTS
jgi:predicted transcriptional regulator